MRRAILMVAAALLVMAGTAGAEWKTVEGKDEMRDVKRSGVFAASEDGGATFWLICGAGPVLNAGVMIQTDTRSAEGLLRFDDAPATKWHSATSDDYKSVFFGSLGGFVAKIGKHSKMRIEITPYHEGPRVLVFDVSGLEETVAAMPCLSAHGK